MAAADQTGPDLFIIIDLAIEDNPYRLILVMDRLVAALTIDDGKTPHAEADPLIRKDPLVIGAAVGKGIAHFFHKRRITAPCNSCYSAHTASQTERS